jgi:hypothetical protein
MVLSETELEGHVNNDDDNLDDMMYNSFKRSIILLQFLSHVRSEVLTVLTEVCCLLGCNAVSSPFAFGKVQVCYIKQIFLFINKYI